MYPTKTHEALQALAVLFMSRPRRPQLSYLTVWLIIQRIYACFVITIPIGVHVWTNIHICVRKSISYMCFEH